MRPIQPGNNRNAAAVAIIPVIINVITIRCPAGGDARCDTGCPAAGDTRCATGRPAGGDTRCDTGCPAAGDAGGGVIPIITNAIITGCAPAGVTGRALTGDTRCDDESGRPIPGVPFRIPARRPLPAVGDNHQHLPRAAGGHRVQRRLQRGSAGPQRVADVGGKNIGAQIQRGGHDSRRLLFGVGRRSAGKNDAVNARPVPPGQGIGAGGNRHRNAVLVKISHRPLPPRAPPGGIRTQPIAGNVSPISGNANGGGVSGSSGVDFGCFVDDGGCPGQGVAPCGGRRRRPRMLRQYGMERTRRIV